MCDAHGLDALFAAGLLSPYNVSKRIVPFPADFDHCAGTSANAVLASCLWAAVDPAAGGPSIVMALPRWLYVVQF